LFWAGGFCGCAFVTYGFNNLGVSDLLGWDVLGCWSLGD
jgi:hypothetical protein